MRFKSLQRFFRQCVEEDELDESPMAGMRVPKVEAAPVPVVSDAVLKKLLKARTGSTMGGQTGHGPRAGFLDTGCRLAEVTDLRQGTWTSATRPDRPGQGQPAPGGHLRGEHLHSARPLSAPARARGPRRHRGGQLPLDGQAVPDVHQRYFRRPAPHMRLRRR